MPFEDERIAFADMPALKASGRLPNGQLPILSVGGEVYSQSVALSRYAARLANLYPAEPLAALVQDEVVASLDEAWSKLPSNDAALRAAYGETVAPKFLVVVAARLGKDMFFGGGSSPQFADLWSYQYVTFMTSGIFDHLDRDFVAKCAPVLVEHAARVKATELYAKFGTPE